VIWGDVRGYMAERNSTYGIADAAKVTRDAIGRVTISHGTVV
jgi:hypothetical protein